MGTSHLRDGEYFDKWRALTGNAALHLRRSRMLEESIAEPRTMEHWNETWGREKSCKISTKLSAKADLRQEPAVEGGSGYAIAEFPPAKVRRGFFSTPMTLSRAIFAFSRILCMAFVIFGQLPSVRGDCAEVAGHVVRALPGSEVECIHGKCQLLILDVASVSTTNLTWAANLLRDCGQRLDRRRLVTQLTNANIHDAVRAWLADEANATSEYGHISNWDTSEVTDMVSLFCSDSKYCAGKNKSSAATFNANISAWNVGKVTSMSKSKLKKTFTVI